MAAPKKKTEGRQTPSPAKKDKSANESSKKSTSAPKKANEPPKNANDAAKTAPESAPEKKKTDDDAGYCTAATLAKFLGKSEVWIGQLTKSGVMKKHRRDSRMLYNFLEAVRDYISYLEERTKFKESDTADEEKKKLEAEVKFKSARAEVAQMELAELQGKLHRSEDVQAVTEDMVYGVRSGLIALPGRVAVDVAEASTAEQAAVIIRKEINLLLGELSNYRYDPKKYDERVRLRQKWDELDAEE